MGELGTGTTITGTGAGSFFAEVLSISGPSGSREAIDMSHMLSTGGKPFKPGDLHDWGEMTVEMALIPGTTIPINGASAEYVITFPDSATTTWTFDGFFTGAEPSIPMEERMTLSVTVKIDGDITVA